MNDFNHLWIGWDCFLNQMEKLIMLKMIEINMHQIFEHLKVQLFAFEDMEMVSVSNDVVKRICNI